MRSSGIWHHVDLVSTEVSEERVNSIFRVERIIELGTLAVTSSATLFLTRTSSQRMTFIFLLSLKIYGIVYSSNPDCILHII
jgi:hypothetical protein